MLPYKLQTHDQLCYLTIQQCLHYYSFLYILILSKPIFTVTFLNMSLLFRLQQDVFSITLLNIANLFVLKPNQGLLYSLPHLNYDCLNCSHNQLFFPIPQFFNSYNFLQYHQIPHNYNNFFLYPHPWCIGFV